MFGYRNTRVEYADQVATTNVDIQQKNNNNMLEDNSNIYIRKPITFRRGNTMKEVVTEDARTNEIIKNRINNNIVKEDPTYYSSRIDNS